ncbi:MAG: BatD family protein [Burkholderiales bacterium]|nr:BatD family protein [Burkholderiales bacterium]
MVKYIIIALLFTLATNPAAAARLSAALDKQAIVLGEPIQLRVVGNTDLGPLDLAPLKNDFEVFSRAVSGGTQNGKVQSVLDATLYPLRAGKLILPALALGTARSQPLKLEVQPTKVSLRAWISPETPMAREPATLHLEIRDEGDLTWSAPTQLDAPNIHLRAQTETTREVQQDGVAVRLREYRWSLLALKSGGQSVTFPILDAYKFGQRLRYPVTAVTFRALPAPAYLPLYLPIGQPTVRAEPLPPEIFLGRPASRVLDIDAPGLSAEGALKSLQFDPPRGMRLYAPSVAPIQIDGRERLRVTLSFAAEETDVSAFPAINLPYFDPKTQRIETLMIPAARLTVRDPLREKIIAAGFILLAVLCLSWLGAKAWPWLKRLRAKRAWLARLDAATDAAALYRVLTRDAPWRANTLRQSAHTLKADTQLTNSLERLRFGAGAPEISFAELKTAWRNIGMQAPISAF